MEEAEDRPASAPASDIPGSSAPADAASAAPITRSPRASQALGAAGATKRCANCGRTQPAKRTRCVQCGAPLVEPQPAAVETPEPAPTATPPAPEPAPVELAATAEPQAAPAALATEPAPPPAESPPAASEPPAPAEAPVAEAEPSEVTLEALLRAVAASSQPVPGIDGPASAAKVEEPTAPPAAKVEEPPAPSAAKVEEPPAPSAAKVEEPHAPAAPDATSGPRREATSAGPLAHVAAASPPATHASATPAPATHAPVRADEKREAGSTTGARPVAPAPKAPTPAPAPAKPRGPAPGVRTIATNPANAPSPASAPKVEAPAGPAALRDQVKHDVENAVRKSVDPVVRGLESSNMNVARIVKAVEALAQDAAKRRKDYDALYAEMRDYKTNFLDVAQRPLYMDLLLLVDALQRVDRRFEEAGESIAKGDAQKAIGEVKDQLLEVLYRRDIEPIPDHPAKLDVTFQKPVRRIEVTDPSEDRTVVQVVREGFRRGKLVLRPQEVVVKRCVSAPSDEGPIPAEVGSEAPSAPATGGETGDPAPPAADAPPAAAPESSS